MSNVYSANYQMPGVGQTERRPAKVIAMVPGVGTLREAASQAW